MNIYLTDIRTWPRQGQCEPRCQVPIGQRSFPSKVIVRTQTDRLTRTVDLSMDSFIIAVIQGSIVGWLVGWSLTSLFSTNTAISETNRVR